MKTRIDSRADRTAEEEKAQLNAEGPAEIIPDKGYLSNDSLVVLKDVKVRSYRSKPERGRAGGGQRLLRMRGELVERCFAHMYETGGMRKTHLRFHDNIIKRLLIHDEDTARLRYTMRRGRLPANAAFKISRSPALTPRP